MSTITIDVDIQRLNLLAQKVEQIANNQSLALRPIDRSTKVDSLPAHNSRQDITLSRKRKRRDVSQVKKLY